MTTSNDLSAMSRRERWHTIIFEADTAEGRAFDALLLIAIGASVVAVCLESIAEVAVAPYRNGQEFYQSADVVLQGDSGQELMRLEAVTRPGVFRQNILESRDALVLVQEALATIKARDND